MSIPPAVLTPAVPAPTSRGGVPRRALLRRAVTAGVAVLAVSAGTALTAAGPAAAAPAPTRQLVSPVGVGAPAVGLLEPSAAQGAALAGSGVNRVMVPVGWDAIQPTPTTWNVAAVKDLRARVTDMSRKGLQVVLDLGLQYPPAWVFDLPGQTRFVNQYGESWTGTGLSTAIPNVVFNTKVRAAEGRYIAYLGRVLAGYPVTEIRVGGMLTGELRYPPADANGHSDAMWFYDPAAQRATPVKGWKPGTGTPAQAQASVDYYFGSLNGYLRWQMQTVAAAFPASGQQVLFPSWGLRPGMLDAAIADSVGSATPRDVVWMIASGLDWEGQVGVMATLAGTGIRSTVYCTWLDAPSYGDSTGGMSPVRYLKSLADAHGLPTAGENTGRGGVAALQATLDAVSSLGLTGAMYMSGHLIDDGSAGLTITDLTTTVGQWRTAHGAWS